MLANIPSEVWESGGAVVIAVIAVQGAFELVKFFVGARRNGHSSNSRNGQQDLNRVHAERIAKLEASHKSIRAELQDLKRKVDCVDTKVTRLIAMNEAMGG
ncbi:MAG: hypothetical protein MI923_20370 [Phycisphaerales bacterium]|nr:hypothetical protein [Phycisphaerales bacterium]